MVAWIVKKVLYRGVKYTVYYGENIQDFCSLAYFNDADEVVKCNENDIHYPTKDYPFFSFKGYTQYSDTESKYTDGILDDIHQYFVKDRKLIEIISTTFEIEKYS